MWGDTVINGGHWGNGKVLFPDEEIALDYIKSLDPDTPVSLSRQLSRVFLIWSEKAALISPEEQQLVGKLEQHLAQTPA